MPLPKAYGLERGWAVAGGLVPIPAGAPVFSALSLGTPSIDEYSPIGTIVGVISGRTTGSTLSMLNDAGGKFQIYHIGPYFYVAAAATATNYATATSHDITILEAAAGYAPKTTTITIAVNDLPTDAEADAIIAAHSGISDLQKWGIRQLVTKLKVNSAWSALDAIWITGGLTLAGSKKNWKNPGTFDLTEHGTTTGRWAQGFGFTGNGTDYYLDSTYNPTTAPGPQFSLNSASFGMWQSAHLAADNVYQLGTGSTLRMIAYSGGGTTTRVNDASTINPGVSLTTPLGVTIASRRSSTQYFLSKNGVGGTFPAATTETVTSTSVGNATFKLLGQVVSSTFSTATIGAAFVGGALSDVQMNSINDALVWWAKFSGSYKIASSGPPTLSTDMVTYGVQLAQCIPSIQSVPMSTGRVFCAHYGYATATGDAEGTNNYNLLQYTEDQGLTYTSAAALLPLDNTVSVIDPHLTLMPDGSLLWIAPYIDSGRKLWAMLLDNPTASNSADFIWHGPFYLDTGFVGRPRYRADGSLRYTASDTTSGGLFSGLDYGSVGVKYNSLKRYGNVVVSERISTIPIPDRATFTASFSGATMTVTGSLVGTIIPWMVITGSGVTTTQITGGSGNVWTLSDAQPTLAGIATVGAISDFAEASVIEQTAGGTLTLFRTKAGEYYTTNPGDGTAGAWTTPAPITSVSTPNSRQDAMRLPSGRIGFAYNASGAGLGRTNLSIGLSAVNGDTPVFTSTYTFDARSSPTPDYSSITPKVDAFGDYTGSFYVGYNRGRGAFANGSTPPTWNYISIAEIDEQSIITAPRSVTIREYNPQP